MAFPSKYWTVPQIPQLQNQSQAWKYLDVRSSGMSQSLPALPLAPAALLSPTADPKHQHRGDSSIHVCPWWAAGSGIALMVFQRCLREFGEPLPTRQWNLSFPGTLRSVGLRICDHNLKWPCHCPHSSPGAQLSNTRNLLWSIEQGTGNKQLAPFLPLTYWMKVDKQLCSPNTSFEELSSVLFLRTAEFKAPFYI